MNAKKHYKYLYIIGKYRLRNQINGIIFAISMQNNNVKKIYKNFNFMKMYKYWEVYETLPIGWEVDKTCGSPLTGFDFCTNGKSILKGGKRALVRTMRKDDQTIKFQEQVKQNYGCQQIETQQKNIFPAKTVNNLARLKFKEKLLKEIMFDLMVCEIEKWDKRKYINELKKLLNGIDTSNKNKANIQITRNLFSQNFHDQ